MACTNLAHLSPNHATHLKSPDMYKFVFCCSFLIKVILNHIILQANFEISAFSMWTLGIILQWKLKESKTVITRNQSSVILLTFLPNISQVQFDFARSRFTHYVFLKMAFLDDAFQNMKTQFAFSCLELTSGNQSYYSLLDKIDSESEFIEPPLEKYETMWYTSTNLDDVFFRHQITTGFGFDKFCKCKPSQKLHYPGLSWLQASMLCKRRGGTLPIVNSREQLEAILVIFRSPIIVDLYTQAVFVGVDSKVSQSSDWNSCACARSLLYAVLCENTSFGPIVAWYK